MDFAQKHGALGVLCSQTIKMIRKWQDDQKPRFQESKITKTKWDFRQRLSALIQK